LQKQQPKSNKTHNRFENDSSERLVSQETLNRLLRYNEVDEDAMLERKTRRKQSIEDRRLLARSRFVVRCHEQEVHDEPPCTTNTDPASQEAALPKQQRRNSIVTNATKASTSPASSSSSQSSSSDDSTISSCDSKQTSKISSAAPSSSSSSFQAKQQQHPPRSVLQAKRKYARNDPILDMLIQVSA